MGQTNKKSRPICFLLSICFCFSLFILPPQAFNQEERVSGPGEYKGYSTPVYDEWVRMSWYVSVRDGTKLAVDIFRPARNGGPVSEPLPLIWTHTRYHRASYTRDGNIRSMINQSWLQHILRHGYIIASVDVRGSGASFGTRRGEFTPEEARDSYDIIEWFAGQPWCDGNIGMFGGSYLGITQYIAAGMAPPHLKAIIPAVAMFDLYSFSHPGGVFQDDFIRDWGDMVRRLDIETPAPPVDEDPQGELARQALEMHKGNIYPMDYTSADAFRDSLITGTRIRPSLEWSPHAYLKGIQEKGTQVAVYTIAGWYDMWPRDALAWVNNLPNPQKLIVLPMSHSGFSEGWKKTTRPLIGFDLDFKITVEHLRWYDYWLKGIQNGIMSEPPITYFTMGAPEKEAWRTARVWPLPESELVAFYFHEGPSGSIASANDGLLRNGPPAGSSGEDSYRVDYTTTSGKTTRWHDGRGMGFGYGDMSENDAKGLTYTTEPLDEDVEVTGHPVVILWVSSTARDGDFFIYLEEVDSSGYSHYITEGVLRASHRRLSDPSYQYMGLPYHRSFEEDIELMHGSEPVKLMFDLHPTSNIFDAGHRIRVTLACADQTSFHTPELSPPPTITVHRNKTHASHILIPVVQPGIEVSPLQENLLLFVLVILALIIAVIFLTWFLKSRIKRVDISKKKVGSKSRLKREK